MEQQKQKVPPPGTEERKQYNRTKKQESREREYAKRNKTIEAWYAAQQQEERLRRNLHFYGEVSPGRDATTLADELQIHREFLRALNKPDVQSGESLRSVAKRTYEGWLSGPYAGNQPGEIYVPG